MAERDHLDTWLDRREASREIQESDRQTAYDELYVASSPKKFILYSISYMISLFFTYLIWALITFTIMIATGWYTATYLIERFYG